MEETKRKRNVKKLTIVFGVLALLFVPTCVYLRIYGLSDVVCYWHMYRHCHPVWKSLALRKISLGDSSDYLEKMHPDGGPEQYGSATYYYFHKPGAVSPTRGYVALVAWKKELVYALALRPGLNAGDREWEFVFFQDEEKVTRCFAERRKLVREWDREWQEEQYEKEAEDEQGPPPNPTPESGPGAPSY
jgi:hypothetical protein